ncbi:MAG: FHA domain-containing protein [Gemmataceae bacterium]
MKIRLKITAADQAFTVEHAGPTLIIGRDPECELALQGRASDLVSRRHAQIDLTPDGAVVRDLDSSNDTLLNERPIRGHGDRPLRAGDTLRMGFTGATLEVLELDLTPAREPAATNPVMPYLLAGAAALLVVVVAAFGLMTLRGRGKPADEVVVNRPKRAR